MLAADAQNRTTTRLGKQGQPGRFVYPPPRRDAPMTKRQMTWLLVLQSVNILISLLSEAVFILRSISDKLGELEREEREAKQ